MKWFRHTELSDDDFELLKGTATMESLQHNRLVIAYGPESTQAKPSELGLFELVGMYYMRKINDQTIELLFSEPNDLTQTEQKLIQFKMAAD